MVKENLKKISQEIFDLADIKINGNRPWDIQIVNEDFYPRVLSSGSMALGESYMDGWWESEKLDEFFSRLINAQIDRKVRDSKKLLAKLAIARIFNLQNIKRSKIVGKKHYDVGNDLYEMMLDKNMNYSCGYWRNAHNLEEAQIAKMDLISRKLMLQPGLKVLDIGCGWGGLSKYLAENYGANVVGLTISKEQMKLAQDRCNGLNVEIRLQDYRDLNEKFDRIVSVGMFEHVGPKNYRKYMKIANNCLIDNGLFLLHTIAGNHSTNTTDPWIDKYIFPNGVLPSAKQITTSYEGIFKLEDWHNFGNYYDTTLMAWYNNFIKSWDKIKKNYSERFKRMWSYYLLSCAGSFRCRRNQLWQIVFSKINSTQKYNSIR